MGNMCIGRKMELEQLYHDLASKKSIRLVVGEAGIGKSSILDGLYILLKNENQAKFLVGYYDKSKALIVESQSVIYPFVIVLEDLLKWIKETDDLNDKLKSTMKRLESTLIKFAKQKGTEMAGALVQDMAKKVGLEETLKVTKEFVKTYKGEKSVTMLAQEYISQNKAHEPILSYVDLFQSLAQEFQEKSFVLIFDQLESAGKGTINFLINFAKLMPDRFHIIASFIVEERIWSDTVARELYEDARDKLADLEYGKEGLKVEGLAAEEIGKWIKSVKGVELPLVPDLNRIRENSAGFPIILNEWINSSISLSGDEWIDEAKGTETSDPAENKLCHYITKRKQGLSDEDIVKLNKMAVLTYPLELNDLAIFLGLNDTQFDYLPMFIDRLKAKGIFEKNERCEWFKHGLVRKCLENSLSDPIRKRYHRNAAEFYQKLENKYNSKDIPYNIKLGCAYHLHESDLPEMREKSYDYNTELAQIASSVGDLDLAERCYKRAINDAEQIEHFEDKKMKCILDLTNSVYVVWGRYNDAYDNYQLLLKSFSDIKSDKDRANVLSSIAKLHYIKQEYDEALRVLNDWMQIEEQLGNQYGIAAVNHSRAMIYENRGEYDEALKVFDENLSIARQASNKLGVSTTSIQLYLYSALYHIANIRRLRKEYEKALELFDESMIIARQASNKLGVSETLHGIASVYYDRGEYEEALKVFDERLSLEKQLGNQSGIAFTLGNIGKILVKQKKYNEAFDYTSEALRILQVLNLPDAKVVQQDLENIKNNLRI
jgi:tetratricopeptide (TPR) repeat protein